MVSSFKDLQPVLRTPRPWTLLTKAAALAGLQGVAGAGLAAIARSLGTGARWVAIVSLSGLMVSLVYSLGAFAVHQYDRSPAPSELWRYADSDVSDLRLRFLSTRFRALRENHARLQLKARRLTKALVLFGLVILASGVAAIGGLVP